MPTVAEALNSKPPLGAALAAGVKALSADETLTFSLYHRYVFPLDGMNYWLKVPDSQSGVAGPGIQPMPGLASETAQENESIQVAPGGIAAMDYAGGVIVNPAAAVDQGLPEAESLFVDFTGPAYHYVEGTTVELEPGESINIPANCTTGAWVTAASKGHQFTVVLQKVIDSVTLPTSVDVKGSFHFTSTVEQREDATVDANEVIFTSLSEIQEFNQIGPDYLYICHYKDLTFAFSSRGRLYEQADLYHYLGKALFSVNATQIVDDPSSFDPDLVVSNSLPIWLNMPNYVPPYPGFVCPIPLYPSFLVDDNLLPPFGSVHIEKTQSLAFSPTYGPRLQSAELSREEVTVHLYGCDNDTAEQFLSFVLQYSRDWMTLGLGNSPNIRDEKHTQPEFKILSQYKTIMFDVSYRQGTSRDIARQFIEHAIVQNQLQYYTGDP